MNSSNHIKSFCSIKDNKVIYNGDLLYTDESELYLDFIKAAYKSFDTNYPKFFKMDGLSKLAFLAADILLKKEKLEVDNESNIAIVFSNKSSSLDTDRKHHEAIKDLENYYPSPSVFVYTLPNICIGEISIKYKLYSENSFFIFNTFNAEYLHSYSNSLIASKKAKEVLCGWVEYNGENYEAFLYLVSNKGTINHSEQNIIKLYNT